MSKDYCEFCNENREYFVEKTKKARVVNEVSIDYDCERAYCKTCGKEMYIPEMNDKNLKNRYGCSK